MDILNFNKKYLRSIRNNEQLVILNLHRISDDENPFYPSLSSKLFEELIKFVTKEFNVITFRRIDQFKKSQKPNIILSFDDGFYDFFENAMPLLDKYNIRANLNVIPQCVESGKPVWDVMLGDILNSASADKINSIELPNFNMKLCHSNKGEYGLALTRYLKKLPKNKRGLLWSKFEKMGIEKNVKFTKMLSREDVIEISNIHEVGVHSYSHESMGVESKDFFEIDFLKCKSYFDDCLNLPMNIYAFPSGSYKDGQVEFLRSNGIAHILLVGEGYSNYQTDEHYRFTFYANSKSEVKLRAVGFHR